ncbi:MAG: hypothetical protein A2748_03415 [Candidatus Wildermuthbacteria bacterium RIFCSPHIGHO2_01_FULL_45_20]|nr:MAG: hypothetical protein A2748_03415 [Candidatus Wildermuthbacteria bacterium RIFCSPHIGHO2_01_FULL_45_20]
MKDDQKRIKVGIIGTGWVADMRHAPVFGRNKKTELVAVYNPQLDLAEAFAKKHNIPCVFNNLEEFLKDPFDLVSICTPPMSHFSLAKKSLEAGKHVLLEKPVTVSTAEALELEELATQNHVILCPAHNFLFCRAMTQAKALIEKGKIGEIIGAMGIQWSSNKRTLPTWFNQLPGGLFFDESPHLLYLLDYFLKDVKIEDAWRTTTPVLDRFEARLKGERGEGLLTMWFGAPLSEWLIIVSGTQGALVIDIFRDVLLYFPPERYRNPQYLFQVIARAEIQIWRQMIAWVITRFTSGSHLFGLDNLVEQLTQAILLNKEQPVQAKEGRKIVNLIEDILKLSKKS